VVGHVGGQCPVCAIEDDLGYWNLLGGIAAVTGTRVDVGRLEYPDPVVVAERLDTQVGGPGEVADGQE